jgi:hypothetical protein
MSDLVVYRDDGPLVSLLGQRPGRGVSLPAPLLTLAGGAVLVAGLASAGGGVSKAVLGIATIGYVLLAGLAAGQRLIGRLDWLVPPLLRVVEYGALLVLALLAEPAAVPACFALLAVLAYHHYNTVYRLRHQRIPPPRWLRFAGGGWELRLLVAYALLVTGGLAIGMIVAATGLAVIYAAETVLSWRRFSYAQRPVLYEQEEDEDQ